MVTIVALSSKKQNKVEMKKKRLTKHAANPLCSPLEFTEAFNISHFEGMHKGTRPELFKGRAKKKNQVGN